MQDPTMANDLFENGLLWEQIFDALPDMVFVINHQHQILYANQVTIDRLGISKADLLNTHCYRWMHNRNSPPKNCPQLKTLQDMCSHTVDALVEGLGVTCWGTVSPVFDQHGNYVASVHIARDITKRVELEQELRYASVHDALTGIFNRSWFNAELERIVKGRVTPVSVIMADIDGLKKINDTEGHDVGDSLLQRAAVLLLNCCRQEDGLARIGGDEFVLLLPGADVDDVNTVLQRIRKQITDEEATYGSKAVSLSLGAATIEDLRHLNDALKSADEHMYQEKALKKCCRNDNRISGNAN